MASFVLNCIGLAPATYYYQFIIKTDSRINNGGRPLPGFCFDKDNRKICDAQIIEWIYQLIEGEGFSYGYRKLTVLLKRKYQLVINKKKVYRLCKQEGLLRPQRKLKAKYPRKLACNRVIKGSNQLWETDIKYGYIYGEDRFFYMLSIIDVYDRTIVAYFKGLNCTGMDAAITLKRALMRRALINCLSKPVIRTDNGPQFISDAFEQACINLEVEHERIPCRTPNKNAHIESFHRILEDDCLSRYQFDSYADAYGKVSDFFKFYNKVRIHGSIKDMAPEMFYLANQRNSMNIAEIRL
jgi:putative transposase